MGVNFNGLFSDGKYTYDFGNEVIGDMFGNPCHDLIHVMIIDKKRDNFLTFAMQDDLVISVDSRFNEMDITKESCLFDILSKLAYEDIIFRFNKRATVTNPTIKGDDNQNTLSVANHGDFLSFKIHQKDGIDSDIVLKNVYYKTPSVCDCDRRNSDYKRRVKLVIYEMIDKLNQVCNKKIEKEEGDLDKV